VSCMSAHMIRGHGHRHSFQPDGLDSRAYEVLMMTTTPTMIGRGARSSRCARHGSVATWRTGRATSHGALNYALRSSPDPRSEVIGVVDSDYRSSGIPAGAHRRRRPMGGVHQGTAGLPRLGERALITERCINPTTEGQEQRDKAPPKSGKRKRSVYKTTRRPCGKPQAQRAGSAAPARLPNRSQGRQTANVMSGDRFGRFSQSITLALRN